MSQLLELVRRIFGPTPTLEQIEIVRHSFHHHDME